MTAADAIRGLYAITDTYGRTTGQLRVQCDAALRGGARVLQYRDKSGNARTRRQQAFLLRELCISHGACFIVNDDIELAAAVGADGVHLGREDPSLERARQRLGHHAIVGASCYDDLDRGQSLLERGADYLAFGSVFPSATKPAAARADSALLRAARARFTVPLVAIGGITAGNAGPVVAAGIDAIAVIAGLFNAGDVESAARGLSGWYR